MSRSVRDYFLFVVVAGFALPALARTPAASQVKEPLRFTVRVYDYAGASEDTLRRAKTAAASVFQYIKIETVWVDCKLPGVAGLADAACTEYQGPTDLVLRLVPHSMAKRYGLRPHALGIALQDGKAEFGYVAGVFFDRLQGLPGWSADERPVILGHLIAHEIGHLLLGSGKHSLAGLMRPGWDRKQLTEAVSGTLHFSPRQAKRIRADVRDRMRAEGSSAAERRRAWGAVLNVFSLSSAGFPSTLRGGQAEPTLEITVRVYRYAQVPSTLLAQAQNEAARIYSRVGVDVKWLDCDLSVEGFPRNPACKPNPLPTQLMLRLLPRSMAERLGLHPKDFGLALPAKKRGFGSVTNVFYHRVKELCASLRLDRDLILGHIMAHEMGHLFLGIGSHSDRGIMHIPWRTKQLDRAAKGNLHSLQRKPSRSAPRCLSDSTLNRMIDGANLSERCEQSVLAAQSG